MIVDERSAAFFALGAAQASGAPVAMLCTSGTAAANYHPAICEADESAMPLIALTADRPPELRGIGAGQTIDQLKLYGSSVRWFCEVGTHEADDDGLLHYRSTACRAFAAARGEPRPGPVHLNLPWREPLAPIAGRGRGDRDRPAGARGPRRRPLTAVTPIDLSPRTSCSTRSPGTSRDAIAGVIVAGRQLDPELREPLAHLAAAAGFPILAEPTSQLRCGPHDRSHVVTTYDLLLRDEHFRRRSSPTSSCASARCRPASRCATGWRARGADQIVVDPCGGWNEPTPRARRRSCAPTRPSWPRAGRRGSARTATAPDAWLEAERDAARRAIEAELGAADEPTEPGLHRALGARPPRRRPRLHRLEHADPRPGGVPAGRARPTPASSATAAPTASTACLLRHRRRPRQRPADDDRHRRPRPAPRHRRPRRPARRLDPGPHRRHRQRRRRHLPLPAAGGGPGRATSSRRCSAPRAASTSPRQPPSSTSPTAASSRSPSCPRPSPPAPA